MKCDKCEKEFETKDALNAHQRIHSTRLNFDDYHKRLSDINKENAKIKKQLAIENYLSSPKRCKSCETIIPYDKKINNFCNRTCSAKFNNSKRDTYSEEYKKSISEGLKFFHNTPEQVQTRKERKRIYKENLKNSLKTKTCRVCGIPINKKNKHDYCITCWFKSDEFQLNIGHGRKYDKQYVYNKWTNTNVYLQSGLEKQYYDYLTKYDIEWIKPEPLKYIKDDKEHSYFCDFYLPQENKYIEVKGYMWENDEVKMKLIQEQHLEIHINILHKKDIKQLK